jgi:cobalt-zinc-cadmium efflux system outer membrane protein
LKRPYPNARSRRPDPPRLRALAVALLIAAMPAVATAADAAQTRSVELGVLIGEALQNSPELAAARREQEAAEHRVKPAGALDDPMLELGVLNVPTGSWSLRREDMTMKMLGLSQRLPYPGKRALREDVAAAEARIAGHGYRETANRVVRDVRTAYADLALADESIRLISQNKAVLEQFLQIAQSRYAVGQAAQADVLKAQTQLSRMVDELIRMNRERRTMAADLDRALGRRGILEERQVQPLTLEEAVPSEEALIRRAEAERPQLLALQTAVARAGKAVELARADYYPDFDVKLAYGQRDRMPDGPRRDDMVSLTVGINLPIWGATKRDPRVAEALAMRGQAQEMHQAQRNEVVMKLRQQVALADQSARSARLYGTAVLPQARLTVEAALAAYKVGRVDLLTLLDSQMTVFNYEINLAQTLAAQTKALAEIDFLAGKAWN